MVYSINSMTSDVPCSLSTVPEDRFCEKALLGCWFENQSDYVKNSPDFKSTYMVDYDPKSLTHGADKGYDASTLLDHQSLDFLENMSTTSDLVYNHMTKQLGSDGPSPRKYQVHLGRYEPVQDYAQNYGNITNFGLREIYKLKREVPNPRPISNTTYHDDYPAPKPEDYIFRRWGISN